MAGACPPPSGLEPTTTRLDDRCASHWHMAHCWCDKFRTKIRPKCFDEKGIEIQKQPEQVIEMRVFCWYYTDSAILWLMCYLIFRITWEISFNIRNYNDGKEWILFWPWWRLSGLHSFSMYTFSVPNALLSYRVTAFFCGYLRAIQIIP